MRVPFAVKRSTSTVGLPRESKIYAMIRSESRYGDASVAEGGGRTWRAWILVMDMVVRRTEGGW